MLNISVYLSCIKYSMLLISTAMVIVVRPLFLFYIKLVWLGGAMVRTLDLRLKGRGFKFQPLRCRVQLWTSCSHTLSSASGVTTLWRIIN